MPKYRVSLIQTVSENITLCVEAHNPEQAEEIAQYIAENGKDPWDRHSVNLEFLSGDITDSPDVVSCEEIPEDSLAEPCNIKPEHTHGLWAPAKEPA